MPVSVQRDPIETTMSNMSGSLTVSAPMKPTEGVRRSHYTLLPLPRTWLHCRAILQATSVDEVLLNTFHRCNESWLILKLFKNSEYR
jgi:hypothetical protein